MCTSAPTDCPGVGSCCRSSSRRTAALARRQFNGTRTASREGGEIPPVAQRFHLLITSRVIYPDLVSIWPGSMLASRITGRPCDHAGMAVLDHSHPVNAAALDQARAGVLPRADAERLSKLLSVVADPIRSRLLFALVAVEELCVGDLAIALGDVNEDQTSYALKQLRGAGLVQTRREGRIINYRLADGFPHQLLQHCLRQLLTITEKGGN